MSDYLSPEQISYLLYKIKHTRVHTDGKGFAHVEAYDIRAHLNRIFGFARWSAEVIDQQLVFEHTTREENRERHTVCYRSIVALTIASPSGHHLATYTEGATGEAINQPSRSAAHDLALKNSQSYALKRAAVNLGDQFGLSLYNKGSEEPIVQRTLVSGETKGAPAEVDEQIAETAPEDTQQEQSMPEQITAEIAADPTEQAELARAAEQIAQGKGRWLEEDENPSDALPVHVQTPDEHILDKLDEIMRKASSPKEKLIELSRLGIVARQTKGVSPQVFAEIDSAIQEAGRGSR